MGSDRPPILQYASPPRVIQRRQSPTVLFGCGVLFACCIYWATAFVSGDIDIPIGPMCDCLVTPVIAAGIFNVSTTVRAKVAGRKLVQRNSYAICGLGIGAFAAQLAIEIGAGVLGWDKWQRPILIILILSLPAISAGIAFRPADAEDRG